MQLSHQQYGDKLLVRAQGRLDASWAEFFADALLNHVRHGHHNLTIDAGEMMFLSSAGIRALLRIHKEISSVQGSFHIVNATEFVVNTLTTIGLDTWLTDEPIIDNKTESNDIPADVNHAADHVVDFYSINEKAGLALSHPSSWKPWQQVQENAIAKLRFTPDTFALGIGSTTELAGNIAADFGEFMAVGGHVIYQSPDEKMRPDYLLSEKDYAPELYTIQATLCQGKMAHLMRFFPGGKSTSFTISELITMMRSQVDTNTLGFVVLAETAGLVGATMIQSPGKIEQNRHIDFPEIRDWVSFCGERVHAGQLTLMFGVAGLPVKEDASQQQTTTSHVHAAVFPYQPIQNGNIVMADSIHKILTGPPPVSLMHLINDMRPVAGLGESALIRGACWFSPVKDQEGQS